VKSLGADSVIDYKTRDFEDVLQDYDVVLNSQDGKTLAKSLRVLKIDGKLISIYGPPDPEFGKESGAPGFVKRTGVNCVRSLALLMLASSAP
jgi:NADPH:quinone reductase-like Zn-dependent oxidoreductase